MTRLLFSSPGACGIALLLAVAGGMLAGRGRAVAQAATPAADPAALSRQLARRALDALHRGADAATREAQLAAYREGLALAQQAIEADESNADAHFAAFANRGRLVELEGMTINPLALWKLQRDLNRALALNPAHPDALAAKGRMCSRLPRWLGGNREQAVEYLSRAHQLDPNDVGVLIDLAEAYRDSGHPERSVPLLEQAVALATAAGDADQLAAARGLLREFTPSPGVAPSASQE